MEQLVQKKNKREKQVAHMKKKENNNSSYIDTQHTLNSYK